jgi:CRP-like cAMP-binding protein
VAQEIHPAAIARPIRNRLLQGLPPGEYRQLRPELQAVSLRQGEILYEEGGHIPYVYFPWDAVVSLRVVMRSGAMVEVGTIGREGLLGLPAFLADGISSNQAIVQVPGQAARLRADLFREAARQLPHLLGLVLRYAQVLADQAMQTAACHRLHPIEERAARWLLLMHDRVGRAHFPLTHEFLAEMLGAGRPAVSVAAGVLQRAGVICDHRGTLTVLDREGLEAAACECYQAIRQSYERLLGPRSDSHRAALVTLTAVPAPCWWPVP